MQNIYTAPYEERLVYYASKMVAGQGKAGWQYELAPVFTIAVTDFNFRHLTPKLVHDVMFVDRESGEPLTDKVHIILCSLQELPERWEDCRTEIEEVLFLIKNMEDMDNTSLAYREGRYADIFDAAKSNRLRKEDVIKYSDSLERLRDIKRGIQEAAELAAEQAAEAAREKALVEGRAEGRAEGQKEERLAMARRMKDGGLSTSMISAFTQLTEEEIQSL